mmetsp:Transcript_6757/g.14708  ORF Transcript_6757/g.14708 Transcript_6757/m.14708 type:complete len:83 (+) Transcript_6757:296-544(+)
MQPFLVGTTMVSMKNRMRGKRASPIRNGRVAPKQATESCHEKGHEKFATTKDAPAKPEEEVSALATGRSVRLAGTMDAPSKP